MRRPTQIKRILARLKKGKLNSFDVTYEMRIKQGPARVQELRLMGYKILSIPKRDRSVDWKLVGAPDSERPYRMELDMVNNTAKKVYIKEVFNNE